MSCQQVPTAPAFNPYPRSVQVGEFEVAIGGGIWVAIGAQATTLQTVFSSLARRAANQEHLRQYETFMGLALKAQAQSRATISALVDLKFPRQATFVKQANIAHGPQQVNNETTTPGGIAHAEEKQRLPNELLEDQSMRPENPS